MTNYKAPIVLSASLVVLLVLHLFVLAPVVKRTVTELVFPVEAGEHIRRLEVRRENGEVIEIVRRTLPGGAYAYDIVRPFQRPAEKLIVDGLLRTLSSQTPDYAEDEAGVDLAKIGLNPPVAAVTVETNLKKTAFKFGKEDPATRAGSRFHPYLIEGREGKIYRMFKPYFDDLVQEADRWRTRQLVAVEVSFVEELGIEYRIEGSGSSYGRIAARREEAANQWRLTAPYDERADWKRVSDLLVQIDQLRVERRIRFAPEILKEHGLDYPGLKVEIRRKGETQPIRILFGSLTVETEKSGDQEIKRKKIAVHLDSTDEVAICDADTIADVLPKKPEDLRPRDLIPYGLNEIERAEIVCHGLGEMALQAEDHTPPADPKTAPRTVRKWVLEKPHGVQYREGEPYYGPQMEAMEMFVENIRRVNILEYWTRDVALPDLEKPECRVTLSVRGPGGQVMLRSYYFEVKGASGFGYARLGESLFEKVRVDRDFVLRLKKLQYNFYIGPVLEVMIPPNRTPRDVFTRLKVKTRYPGGGQEQFELKRDDQGEWGSDRQGRYLLDMEKLLLLFQQLARLFPVQIMSMNPGELPMYNLVDPPIELELSWDSGAALQTRVLKLSPRAQGNLVFGVLDGSPLIFQVRPELLETIEQLHTLPYEGHDPTKGRKEK